MQNPKPSKPQLPSVSQAEAVNLGGPSDYAPDLSGVVPSHPDSKIDDPQNGRFKSPRPLGLAWIELNLLCHMKCPQSLQASLCVIT